MHTRSLSYHRNSAKQKTPSSIINKQCVLHIFNPFLSKIKRNWVYFEVGVCLNEAKNSRLAVQSCRFGNLITKLNIFPEF